MDRAQAKVAARQDLRFHIQGDSRAAGAVGGGTSTGGWVYRLLPKWAERIDYNYRIKHSEGGGAGYPNDASDDDFVTSAEGEDGPWIIVELRTVSGFGISQLGAATCAGYVDADPDLVMLNWGHNDRGALSQTSATVAGLLDDTIENIQTEHGTDTPILIGTGGPAQSGGAYTGSLTVADFEDFFSDIAEHFTGQRMPLSPVVLDATGGRTNVAVIDTWPPYGGVAPTVDGVHPSDVEYEAEAVWRDQHLPLAIPVPRLRAGDDTFQTWTWVGGELTPVFESIPVDD